MIWIFKNGYGLSVIKHSFSYGNAQGLWEAAVITGSVNNFSINSKNPISSEWGDEVKGYLTDSDIDELLGQVENLKKTNK